MEIVLSPGRFGDETPGVPFQKEEIREWSHVDRLTGMLERARIETGRWQSSNPEAAKSYGKVIDSRERNSADGSVVQRARRQVEIFQSQGRGRSVQVVRASQWSSSRVTDSASTGSSILPVLDQRQITEGKDERNTCEKSATVARPAAKTKNDRRSRQEAISERLSALLGAFPYPVSSSTVPLRRIDSRYSTRAPIIFASAKRSNSNEDLAIIARENTKIGEQDLVERMVSSGVDRSMLKYGGTNLSNIGPTRGRDSDETSAKRSNNAKESTCKPARSAIQLLPSSKSNTTVVNLMGDERTRQDAEILDDERSSLNWMRQTSPKNSQRDSRNEDSPSLPITCQKFPKRVGFSKTEIHFDADSGKVNIVETDEKPPPTNKFRRKKRIVATSKINAQPSHVVAADSMTYETSKINDEALDTTSSIPPDRDIEVCEENAKNEHHRGHTTTVKLGTEITRNQDREGQFCKGEGEASMQAGAREASSQGIVLRLENRIYDRLEAYTTEMQPRTDIHQTSALKSARLVMNLTRGPQSSRVVVEPGIATRVYEADRGEDFVEISAHDDERTTRKVEREEATSTRRNDWKNDGKTKNSKGAGRDVEKAFVDDRDGDRSRGFVDKIEESENIREINESLTIGKEAMERAASSEPEKKVPPSSQSKRQDDSSTEDYDVVCTDAENNQVVLKVVTTHEPTIARVADRNDHFSKRLKKPAIKKRAPKGQETPGKKKSQTEHTYVNIYTGSSKNEPIYEYFGPPNIRKVERHDSLESTKKEANPWPEKSSRVPESKSQISDRNDHFSKPLKKPAIKKRAPKGQESPEKKKSQTEHTYVNVFTGSSKNDPIYEYYGPPNTRKVERVDSLESTKKEANSCHEKSSRVPESKCQISQPCESSVTTDLPNSEKTRTSVDGRTTTEARVVESSNDDKKLRVDKKEAKNCPGTSRLRGSRTTKSQSGNKRAGKCDVSSNERDSRLSTGTYDEKLEPSPRSATREISSASTRTRNNEIARKKPMEVVYQTAVYNMKNEKLSKPHKKGNRESSRGPRYINELICGAKTKSKTRSSDSKTKSNVSFLRYK